MNCVIRKTVTVAELSKACTVFARSKAGIMGSNPTQGMDVLCVCVRFSVFLYRRADNPHQESYRMSKI
jgi:hypothetical protein